MACKRCGDPAIDSKYNCHACDVSLGRFQWCVITHGPTEDPTEGNHYDKTVAFDETEVELFDGTHKPRVIAKKGSPGFIHFKERVFEVGEIFPVGKDFGREITGAGRKPSKWDIGYVLLGSRDYKEAIALAIKVQKEQTNLEMLEQKSIEKEQLTTK